MNLIIDPLFIFIYLFALFYLGIPNIDSEDLLKHKLVIFLAVFCFNFALQLIKNVRSKCLVRSDRILNDSVITSLIAVIGYSICTDLAVMEYTKDWVAETFTNYNKKSVIIALTIAVFIALAKITGAIVKPDHECISEMDERL